ncbi:hypothetical protein BC332_19402 [Capsicum chinense]|nr:hypothetical protein BC332_19402 [Capsicum chinense]
MVGEVRHGQDLVRVVTYHHVVGNMLLRDHIFWTPYSVSSGLNELEIDNDFIKPMDTRKNGEILWMANHSLRLLVSVDDVVEKAKDVDLGKSTIHVMLLFTKRSLFYLRNRKVIVLEMLVRSHPVYVKESPKLGDKGSYEQKLKVECENCLCFAHEWIAIRVKNEREMVAEEWKEEAQSEMDMVDLL